MNFNKSFNASSDPYKYQINILISKINLNLNPDCLSDIYRLKSFIEMFSYSDSLKRFRPLIKPGYFVDKENLSANEKKVRTLVIRDWFALALWYIRLRKAAKGTTPFKLLEIEERIQ